MSKFTDEFDNLTGCGKFIVIIIIAIIWLLLNFPLMWLWNYVMPDLIVINGQQVFHQLDYWHTVALDVLCSMLFYHNSSK